MNGSYVLDGTTQAMVASLDSQEERDRLTHFLTVDLQDGKGTGILGDVFLLLKANRCYMEKLPGQFNRELVQPLIENMLRIETSLARQIEVQEKIADQMDRCFVSASRSADRVEAVVPKIERVVQNSFDNIDSSKITQKIEDTVTEGVVKPVAKVNDECGHLQEKLKERLPILTGALKWLTIGNLVVWALSCALLIGAVAIYVVFSMEQEMVGTLQTRVREEIEKIHATAKINEETLDALSRLSVQIEIHPQKDWLGNEVQNHYCLAMKGANSGSTVYKDGERYGAIFFQDQTIFLDLHSD